MNEKARKAYKAYQEKAFTDNYIIVCKHLKQTIAIFVDGNALEEFAYIDGKKLRLNLTTYAVKKLRRKAWQVVSLGGQYAVEEETARLTASGKHYNKGNGAESLVMKRYNQVWAWDNESYTNAPDLWIDGVPYQVKTYKATFDKLENLGL